MQRRRPWFAVIVGSCLLGCAGPIPTGESASERDGIVGGMVDSTDTAVIGMLINNQDLCSGTLIAPNLVLTARHCVAEVSTGEGEIDCTQSSFSAPFTPGSFGLSSAEDLTMKVPSDTVFQVSSVHVPDATLVCGNDVALLVLSTNVPSTIAVPFTPRVDQAPEDNEAYTAIGYGLTDPSDTEGTTAGVRHSISGLSVGCVGAAECGVARASDNEWAAGSAICHGDSGGPALDAEGRVIGVASRGDETCALGLYTSVAAWKSLIVSTATAAATTGGYQAPSWTSDDTDVDAGTTANGGSGPGLGETCESGCSADLLCYSPNSQPPGVCVPPCGSDNTCPTTYTCDVALNACLPAPKASTGTTKTDSGCGCHIGDDRTHASAWPTLAALALCGGMLRRKRRGAASA